MCQSYMMGMLLIRFRRMYSESLYSSELYVHNSTMMGVLLYKNSVFQLPNLRVR